jgi:hypothetical protein
MPSDDEYLIWSNEHRGWWKAVSLGYNAGLKHAGCYTRAEAIAICRNAMWTAPSIGVISEIPVRMIDIVEMMVDQPVPRAILDGDVFGG